MQKEENNVIRTIELNYGGISAMIQSAPQLEELRLAFSMSSQAPLRVALSTLYRIPSCVLSEWRLYFRDLSCLVRFCCRHATTPKILELSELCLQTSSWETVFTGLIDRLSLDRKYNLQSLGRCTCDGTWTSGPQWCTSAGIRRHKQYTSFVLILVC